MEMASIVRSLLSLRKQRAYIPTTREPSARNRRITGPLLCTTHTDWLPTIMPAHCRGQQDAEQSPPNRCTYEERRARGVIVLNCCRAVHGAVRDPTRRAVIQAPVCVEQYVVSTHILNANITLHTYQRVEGRR